MVKTPELEDAENLSLLVLQSSSEQRIVERFGHLILIEDQEKKKKKVHHHQSIEVSIGFDFWCIFSSCKQFCKRNLYLNSI